MEKKSIAVLKQLFEAEELNEELLSQLKLDERKGVQQLIRTYENRRLKKQALEQQFKDMCRFEERCYLNGFEYIAGIDEAGRGPLAGPVVAAAVILPRDFTLLGLNDSKQLSETARNQYYTIIKNEAISYGISIINNQKIDEINIFEATKSAMYDAINQLDPKPHHILIDAVDLRDLPCTYEAITKGDAKSVSIAAASILAKVTRDDLMKEMHKEYPLYEFASNMGYGTKDHIKNLQEFGPSPYHRKSFAPVRNLVN